MKNFNWKEKYYNYFGENIVNNTNYKYVSSLGNKYTGDGTKNNPYYPNPTKSAYYILSSGNFNMYLPNSNTYIVGTNKYNTIVDTLRIHYTNNYINEVTLKNLIIITQTRSGNMLYLRDCILDNFQISNPQSEIEFLSLFMENLIIKDFFSLYSSIRSAKNNTIYNIIDTTNIISKFTNSVFNECTLMVNQTFLNNYPNYNGFNKCKFQIGTETIATELIGNTQSELKQNFIDRCTAGGLTYVNFNRWIFSNNSISGYGDIIINSDIHKFCVDNAINLGYSGNYINNINITSKSNIINSISEDNPSYKIKVEDDSILLSDVDDITKRVQGYIDSKVIWLGGLKTIDKLNIIHNLNTEAGISNNKLYSLDQDETESGNLIKGEYYIIRSSDDKLSSILYDTLEYSSSLILRNNILTANDNNEFTVTEGSPKLYRINNISNILANSMRIVREIPTDEYKSGKLETGYWYIVNPDNLSDTTGYVTYKNIKRPCYDSFLVDNDLDFTISGNIHLRRCWKQDFDYETESLDKEFWNNKNKPLYFDIVPNDLRVFYKNHSSGSVEFLEKDNTYVATGHPDFYNGISGDSGYRYPAYNIIGSYMQLRIPITTINPI